MPSPFPGMDPYLENPAIWPNVHHRLISELEDELNHQLRPRYITMVEERVYLSDQSDPAWPFLIPDVHIIAGFQKRSKRPRSDYAGVATIEPVEVRSEDEIHEARVEIVDARDRSIVTVIEILSPTNKIRGCYGRESYMGKRREVLRSASHLVEIDLLRGGLRIPISGPIPPDDYLVLVSRALEVQRRKLAWPIPMQLRLPVIDIPLKGDDPDAKVDLQQLLSTAYERGAFDLKVDYSADPVPHLDPEQTPWAKQMIAAQQGG